MSKSFAVLFLCLVASQAVADYTDPAYKAGFGKDATGGQGGTTCTVTSSANTIAAGTLWDCTDTANTIVQFAVSSAALPDIRYLPSNITIDGCLNGQNGVTINLDQSGFRQSIVIASGTVNVIIRCLNFRSLGSPNSGFLEEDELSIDGDTATIVEDVFVDRCTFYQASDGALDIVGNVADVTVQRSFFHHNAITQLIKYDARDRISLHHNVYAHGGERNPQIKGDADLMDFVNNVVFDCDVPNFPDGTIVSPYGLLVWQCTGCDSVGTPKVNVRSSAFLPTNCDFDVTGTPELYVSDIICDVTFCGSSNHAQHVIPSGYEIEALAANQLALMLPYVGSPTRVGNDQAVLDEVEAALPDVGEQPGVLKRHCIGAFCFPK